MRKTCHNCLHGQTHPFGITYIDNICSGCYTHAEKNNIEWQVKYEELLKIILKFKSKLSSSFVYDCVVPVKGVAEDYFVVEQVLQLGLNPLLVAVNDYFFNDIGWHNLHNLITTFDLDSQIYSPNIHDYRELVKTAFRKYSHILYPSLSLNASYPVHVAIERNIPLIIWGQLQPIEQCGKFSHHDLVSMTKWSQLEHDRLGLDIDQMIGNGAQLNPDYMTYYDYPKKATRLGRRAPIGLYLSNFFRWDPFKQNFSMLKYGFKPQYETATFDPYERAGSSVYYTAHEISRLLRHGYRKVRDHINREIRHNRISRDEGIVIYDYYSTQKINIDPFFDWLDVKQSAKEWIVQHLLSGHVNLICNESSLPSSSIDLPESITNLLGTTFSPELNFIAYGKGI